MKPKERLRKALEYKKPDLIPLDLGSNAATGIHRDAYSNLRNFLGLSNMEMPYQYSSKMLDAVIPGEDVLALLNIDTRGIFLGIPSNSSSGQNDDGTWKDIWGVSRKRTGNNGYYNLSNSPFEKENITLKEISDYAWPDPADKGFFENLTENLKKINTEEYAVLLNINGQVVHISQFMRGFKLWYEDLVLRPQLISELMDRITGIFVEIIDNSFKYLGNFSKTIDIVFFADDLGTQESLQVSPDTYRKVIKPFHKKLYNHVKKNYGKYVMLHSCGAIFPIIYDLIECGVDILNPIQVSAKGMDIKKLKQEFRGKITFWGGIDGMNLLPRGTLQEIKSAVNDTIGILGAGGGYVLCSTHNIQPDVPAENILEMYRAARDYLN